MKGAKITITAFSSYGRNKPKKPKGDDETGEKPELNSDEEDEEEDLRPGNKKAHTSASKFKKLKQAIKKAQLDVQLQDKLLNRMHTAERNLQHQ